MQFPSFKLSRFNIIEHLPDKDQIAILNTMTMGAGLLPAQVYSQAHQGAIDHGETIKHMLDQGFLVPSDVDENVGLTHFRHIQTYDLSNLKYHILTTRGCDLGCGFCYFGRLDSIKMMTPETARSLIDFIINEVRAGNPQSLKISFGGPDANLNKEIIIYVSEAIHRFCQGKGLDLEIDLVSHGLDLDSEFIESLKHYSLSRLKVVLTGPARVYNEARPIKEGGLGYERVFENLTALAGLVDLEVLYFYKIADEQPKENLLALLDDLIVFGLREYIHRIHFFPVLNATIGCDKSNIPVGIPDCQVNQDADMYLWLKNQAVLLGFPVAVQSLDFSCSASYRHTKVIDFFGRIIPCSFINGTGDNCLGQVDSGMVFFREARLIARRLPDKCRTQCPIAPLCDGGCRMQAHRLTGSFNGIDCRQNELESILKAYLKQTAGTHKPL